MVNTGSKSGLKRRRSVGSATAWIGKPVAAVCLSTLLFSDTVHGDGVGAWHVLLLIWGAVPTTAGEALESGSATTLSSLEPAKIPRTRFVGNFNILKVANKTINSNNNNDRRMRTDPPPCCQVARQRQMAVQHVREEECRQLVG